MKPPNILDPRFQEFVETLKSENVRPAKGLALLNQREHGLIIEVPLNLEREYPALHCWYNSIEEAFRTNGKVIFGWGLWQIADSRFIAQHHAVVKKKDEVYCDVTPNASSQKIVMFMPDNRAPFDFRELKAPASFEYEKNVCKRWVYPNVHESDDFWVMAMEASDDILKIKSSWQYPLPIEE